MANTEVEWEGIDELREAIRRNPNKVLDETRNFLQRGMAVYRSGVQNDPWRVGGVGGGAPVSNDPRYPRKNQKVKSGNLRDSHYILQDKLQASIQPNIILANYGVYVHNGTRRMTARPWMDYVKKTKDGEIRSLYRTLLSNIARDLAT